MVCCIEYPHLMKKIQMVLLVLYNVSNFIIGYITQQSYTRGFRWDVTSWMPLNVI